RLRGIELAIERVERPADTASVFPDALPVLGTDDGGYWPGVPDKEGATLALRSLQLATSCAVDESAGGVVTGPIAKAQLAAIGFPFPGQTEFMANACGLGPDNAVMMLAGPQLRTVPITVHCPLSEVTERLTTGL